MASRNPETEGNLRRLNEMDDFDVAEDNPDPRGWDVVVSDGRTIGEVDQLIVDTSAMKVRYLDCDLDEDELGLEDRDRHILIPIGFARLERDEAKVVVDRISSEDVKTLPPYRGGPITRDVEEQIRPRFERGGMAPGRAGEGEARITRAEEELAIGKRQVEAGEVEVDKHIETEHVRRPVTRRHEEVEVERHPVTGREAERAEFREEEVHIPIREEEIVVEKRPQVKEELVVRKRPVEETEEVEADVRRERLEIERHGRERGREGEGRGRGRGRDGGSAKKR